MHRPLIAATLAAVLCLAISPAARAHCDSRDGPVARDAAAALERRDVDLVLRWVKPADEAAIRTAFERTLAVRAGGAAAKALADDYFLETLVRLHRAGEGEPFTGLKPAGSAEPGLVEADEALRRESADALADELANELRAGIRGRHAHARQRAELAGRDLAAGREYVAAYVDYVHFVEAAHTLVRRGAGHGHAEDGSHGHE